MSREADPVGRYRIGKVVRGSGMATVFAARDLLLGVEVEIEICDVESFGSPERVEVFIRQTRAAAEIQSEHMRRILDVGIDQGRLYTVGEVVGEGDLTQWLRRHGAMPIEQAVDFLLQTCAVLAEAHSRGIVHRDIKPAHLFVVERPGVAPSIKVDGWGLSRSLGSVSTTEEGQIVGTPAFWPPERFKANIGDERGDIWSLGITLCELVTGDLPFKVGPIGTGMINSAILSDAPLPFPASFPHLPRGLQAVIVKCLEKDPRQRYQSVVELALALRGLRAPD